MWVGKPGGLAHAGCCATMPADTYLRFAMLLLDDGVWGGKRLLPKGYVAQMRKGTAEICRVALAMVAPWFGARSVSPSTMCTWSMRRSSSSATI